MSDELLQAIQTHDVERVAMLLAAGADPQVDDNDWMTVFDHLRLMDPPEDSPSRERLHEIRQLLGEPRAEGANGA